MNGGKHIDDTASHTDGPWRVFYPIGQCVINTITRPGFGSTPQTAITTSVPLYGEITAVQLTSGKADLIK